MFHAGTTRLITYWSGLAGGRTPARANFDPVAVADLLPRMFLAARDGDRLALRIAGETLRDLFGRSVKGDDLFDLFMPAARHLARRATLQAVRESRPMALLAAGRTREGASVAIEILIAPLAGPAGAADRLVGLMQPTGPLSALGGRPIVELSIRMAAPAGGAAAARPGLRLVSVDGRDIA